MKLTRANVNREYVTDPRDWAYKVGTDYLWLPSTNTALITSGTAGEVLSEFGWVTTALSFGAPVGGDFLSSADVGATDAQNAILLGATADIVRSPVIFGDYMHARAVQQILGYFPTKLTLETYAALTVRSANETQTAFGFLIGGGTASVAADHTAAITSNGTNVLLRSEPAGGALTDNGGTIGVVGAGYHMWKITLDATNIEWFMDGTSQGTISMSTVTEEFPVSFFGHALTTNRINIGFIHIYYS
jgi:hypothetical protein